MKILAFDIGGTKIAYALVDEHGNIVSEINKIPTPETAKKIKEKIEKIVSAKKIDGLAIATAGVVFNNKLEHKPLNLPKDYEKIDFASFSDLPVLVENDANAVAWCEYKIGCAQNCAHAIILALGTGVGCGIICDEKLLKGKSGAAGEICANISGKDLAELAEKHNLPQDCFELYELMKKGDKKALKVYNCWHKRLFKTLIFLNNLFDTQKIVLAGSLAKIADIQKLQTQLDLNSYGVSPLVCRAESHDFPALSGVALLWMEKYFNKDISK